MATLINGKTPWEFACEWYSENETADCIRRSSVFRTGRENVPVDIYCPAFAKWLTEQYRLAMNKGIEIGLNAMQTRLAEVEAERDTLAKLASDEPQFYNPMHAIEAKNLRDRILKK